MKNNLHTFTIAILNTKRHSNKKNLDDLTMINKTIKKTPS